MSHSAASLGLGAIGVVVSRCFFGFLLRASTAIPGVRCCLGWIWLSLSPYGYIAVNWSALFLGLLLLKFRFLPDDGSHRCHQFVVPLRHWGSSSGGTSKTTLRMLVEINFYSFHLHSIVISYNNRMTAFLLSVPELTPSYLFPLGFYPDRFR